MGPKEKPVFWGKGGATSVLADDVADFTERMLEQVRETESRRVLRKLFCRKDLPWQRASFLAVCGAVFIPDKIIAMLRGIGGGIVEYWDGLAGRVPHFVETVGGEWQFYAVLAVVAGFSVYCMVDLLVGDRLRMR